MTKDEIYEHLAKVYLGKREGVQPMQAKRFNVWLLINVVITLIILASTMWGFTAFLTRRNELKNSIIYSLNNSPIRIGYDFSEPFPQSKTFSLALPSLDVSKYQKIKLAIRGLEGSGTIVKLVVANQKNEQANFFLQNIKHEWQNFSIPFKDLNITDWTNITRIGFVLEAWNVEGNQGTVLIDDISFSN